MQVPADTIIKPADENTITSVCDGVDFSYGICARNSLTIEAGGQLTAISGESILRSCGIFVYCENLAITGGTTGTAFSPDAACTRAQIVKFLYRCLG
ncbi:MAG: hypothetical protein SOX55_08990 [Dysosmobacter sp.]|nr:hypothetical protein [Dysosmobacter sp.]